MVDHPKARGFVTLSAYETLRLLSETDVLVHPATSVEQGVPDGGPVLTGVAAASAARHVRNGGAVGGVPEVGDADAVRIDENLVWGGYIPPVPDRLAGEFASRLLPARFERPEDRVLFCAWPGLDVDAIDARTWEILAWFGYPRERVRVIDSPVRVAELWIAPPAEQSAGVGPSYRYLEMLAANTEAQDLVPAASEVAFVPRGAKGAGETPAALGEGYLVECLERLGVSILDPKALSLREMLAGMAGAKRLILSDGPALRLRQLLGYYEQSLIVLPRFAGVRSGLQALLPRGNDLTYAEVTGGMLAPVRRNGQADRAVGAALLDMAAMCDLFEQSGVPLSDVWQAEEHDARCRDDLDRWLSDTFSAERKADKRYDWAASLKRVRATIKRRNVPHSPAALETHLSDTPAAKEEP